MELTQKSYCGRYWTKHDIPIAHLGRLVGELTPPVFWMSREKRGRVQLGDVRLIESGAALGRSSRPRLYAADHIQPGRFLAADMVRWKIVNIFIEAAADASDPLRQRYGGLQIGWSA